MPNIFSRSLAAAEASTGWETPRESFLTRVLDWLAAANETDESASIAAYIEQNGGVLTDQLEREISRKFGHMAGR